MNRPVQLGWNVFAWENAGGLVKRRGTGRGESGEWSRSETSKSYLPPSPSLFLSPLLASFSSSSQTSCPSLFLPSFPPLLRDLELETTILPAGRFHLIREECSRKEFRGKGEAEKKKERKKRRRERERETLESRSSTFTWRRHSGHNYVANRVNEFFPACRISRATRVKSRRRRILRLSEFISGNKRLRHRLRFRFREFVSFVVFSVFPVRDESFFFFSVLFGCN